MQMCIRDRVEIVIYTRACRYISLSMLSDFVHILLRIVLSFIVSCQIAIYIALDLTSIQASSDGKPFLSISIIINVNFRVICSVFMPFSIFWSCSVLYPHSFYKFLPTKHVSCVYGGAHILISNCYSAYAVKQVVRNLIETRNSTSYFVLKSTFNFTAINITYSQLLRNVVLRGN